MAELNVVIKREKKGTRTNNLQKYFNLTDNNIEVGIDEAGRGPMLGRVYTAAVVLPKDDSFNHLLMKDSKKFHSVKKIKEVAEYIKKNALYWHVAYADERKIDEINILNATHKAMHEAVKALIDKASIDKALIDKALIDKASIDKALIDKALIDKAKDTLPHSFHLLVDGNNFKPFRVVNPDMSLEQIRHTCIEGGDNMYTAIAAASILAKVERDTYIEELCKAEPLLDERYGLRSNKGYGTKTHMDGIAKHGISPYHRKSFGICKQYA
jgi:ribonuclease HII